MEKEIWQKYRDRGLVVIGIDTSERGGDPRELARQFISGHGVTYPAVLDTEDAASTAYRVQALPTIAIIDQGGVLRYQEQGFEEAAVTAKIQQLLQTK